MAVRKDSLLAGRPLLLGLAFSLILGASAGAQSPSEPVCACDPAFDFKNVPPGHPLSRPGMFAIPPSGAGYYSLLDAFRGDWREKAPQTPFPAFSLMQPPFFDADWRFLDNPSTPPQTLSER